MAKTKNFTKATAVLMAVIMMFVALGITAFATSYVKLYPQGSATNMSVKVEFNDCNYSGVRSTPATFTINSKRSCSVTFTTSSPSATIKFYKDKEDKPSVTFTTPKYFSGMPSTLDTGIELGAGTYTVAVSSASQFNTVSGYFIIRDVSRVDGE